jgi:hypothetical protein
VGLPKKFNVHLGQKVPFVLACFQVSALPRLENPDSDEKDGLFGLDTQITILGKARDRNRKELLRHINMEGILYFV